MRNACPRKADISPPNGEAKPSPEERGSAMMLVLGFPMSSACTGNSLLSKPFPPRLSLRHTHTQGAGEKDRLYPCQLLSLICKENSNLPSQAINGHYVLGHFLAAVQQPPTFPVGKSQPCFLTLLIVSCKNQQSHPEPSGNDAWIQ